jgi:tetratricopeptide (TPR) repeat protein
MGIACALLLGWTALSVWVHQVHNALIFEAGDWRGAERWLRWFGFMIPARLRRLSALTIAEYAGHTALALERAEQLLSAHDDLSSLNGGVNAFINAGQYGRALEVAARWTAPPSDPAPLAWALLQVNLAEAEYNLGRWDAALSRLDRVRASCNPRGLANAGERQQRAWILAHLGRPGEARAALSGIDTRDLPGIFHAEHQFTMARVALAAGEVEQAYRDVQRGLSLARRASSVRNGLFLRARILAVRGATDGALRDFEKAAALPFRTQGGDGLLAWGDLLRAQRREQEAQSAFALAVERDGESVSARHASERLSLES